MYNKEKRGFYMKNWMIGLLVLVVPVALYLGLKNNKDMQTSTAALAADKPCVIKFSSPMCMDCKKIKGELEPLKPVYKDSVTFIEIDATSNDKKTQEQVETYGVTVVPTIVFLDETNKKVRKIEGFAPKAKLEQYIKELIHG